MLEEIRDYLEANASMDSALTLVERIHFQGTKEFTLIRKAAEVAQREFDGRYRDNGDDYFIHLLSVTLILIKFLCVTDANLIAAAILHDILEDIKGWSFEHLATEFNLEVALLVRSVSKDPLEVFDGDKDERDAAYYEKLWRAPLFSILLKLSDVLHNGMTLWDSNNERVMNKIAQIKYVYLPLARHHRIFQRELKEVFRELKLLTEKQKTNN